MNFPLPFKVLWPNVAQPKHIPLELLGAVPPNEAVRAAITDNLCLLFDNQVQIGSGVLVRLRDGRLALLTARHVVINLMVGGAIHVVVPQWGWTSFEPRLVRVHHRADAALVELDAGSAQPGGIAWDQWNPRTSEWAQGSVFAAGIPGEWKNGVDVKSRTINKVQALGFSTYVHPNGGSRSYPLLLPNVEGLPTRFGGMSGGPVVHSLTGRIIGVITHESLTPPLTLFAAPVNQLVELIEHFEPPDGTPEDMLRQVAGAAVPVRYVDSGRFPCGIFHLVGVFEHFWSKSRPDVRFSRLIGIGCATSPSSKRFQLNTESVFEPRNGDLAHQIQECQAELYFTLNTPELRVLESGPPVSPETEALLASMIRRLTRGRLTLMRPEVKP